MSFIVEFVYFGMIIFILRECKIYNETSLNFFLLLLLICINTCFSLQNEKSSQHKNKVFNESQNDRKSKKSDKK